MVAAATVTTTATTMTCPHCGGSVPAAGFCQSCGRALPAAVRTGPRIIFGDTLPVGVIARQLAGHQFHKETNRAAYTLLIVGIIVMGFGLLGWAAMSNANGEVSSGGKMIVLGLVILGGTFMGLFSWAWKSPLAPSIIGLVLYSTLVVLKVYATIASGEFGRPRNGIGGSGIGWLDVVVVVVLVQGIQAALRHRRLQERRA